MNKYKLEVEQGERFEFGTNWTQFLEVLNEERIKIAEDSLKQMLDTDNLDGKTFLDIGSGSGLSSLAAKRLGARVYSFDYDPHSVACTQELKRRYFNDDGSWVIEEGSALDNNYLNSLGQFDVVYSWGVLHHTGDMWEALNNAAPLVKDSGQLFIAIYNDQGGASRRWLYLKKLYNQRPLLRHPLIFLTLCRQWRLTFIKDTLKGHPLRSWKNYKVTRGMSAWHDVVDWIGGYPFEVAMPEEIFDFYRGRDFELQRLKTCAGGLGCNEFVFRKLAR